MMRGNKVYDPLCSFPKPFPNALFPARFSVSP